MDYCYTFSDPNSALSCLTTNVQGTSAQRTMVTALDAKCGWDAGVSGNEEVIPFLTDATAADLTTCIGAANDCAGAKACFSSNTVTQPFAVCGMFQ